MTMLERMQNPSFKDGSSTFFKILAASMHRKEAFSILLCMNASSEHLEKAAAVTLFRFFNDFKPNPDGSYKELRSYQLMQQDLTYLFSCSDSQANSANLLSICLNFMFPVCEHISEHFDKDTVHNYFPEDVFKPLLSFENQNFTFDGYAVKHKKQIFKYFKENFYKLSEPIIVRFAIDLSELCKDLKNAIIGSQRNPNACYDQCFEFLRSEIYQIIDLLEQVGKIQTLTDWKVSENEKLLNSLGYTDQMYGENIPRHVNMFLDRFDQNNLSYAFRQQ